MPPSLLSRKPVSAFPPILTACLDIRRQLGELASQCYGVAAERIRVAPGVVHLPEEDRSFTEVLQDRLGRVKGEVIGVGSARSEYVKDHPLGGPPAFYEVVAIAAEVGRAINPQAVAMQDEGAAVQGLGHSLMERYILDSSGRIRNLGALDYRIPTTKEVPRELRSIHIEHADGPGPYGAKGVAEGGILATDPAIGAAVEQAVGVRIRDLPLTPERIWTELNRTTQP